MSNEVIPTHLLYQGPLGLIVCQKAFFFASFPRELKWRFFLDSNREKPAFIRFSVAFSKCPRNFLPASFAFGFLHPLDAFSF